DAADIVCAGVLHHHGTGNFIALRTSWCHGNQSEAGGDCRGHWRLCSKFLWGGDSTTLRVVRRRHTWPVYPDKGNQRTARGLCRPAAVFISEKVKAALK